MGKELELYAFLTSPLGHDEWLCFASAILLLHCKSQVSAG